MPTVIKAGHGSPLLRKTGTIDLNDHVSEARALLESARRQAAQRLAAAEREAERIQVAAEQASLVSQEKARHDGHARGYEEGLAAGTAAGREEAFRQSSEQFTREQSELIESMRQLIRGVEEQRKAILTTTENHLFEFAVGVAGRLTLALGKFYREAAEENLQRALRLVEGQAGLVVRLHPRDLDAMKTFASTALGTLQDSTAIRTVADESLAPGGCIVECATTKVDASLDSQIAEMVDQLLGAQNQP
jgi:flagellar assembly protein FliH